MDKFSLSSLRIEDVGLIVLVFFVCTLAARIVWSITSHHPTFIVDTAFLKSKFDNICLLSIIVFLVFLITWVDKHGNGDYEKWLEVFLAGFGGAYLGLIKGSRDVTGPTTRTGDINTVVEIPKEKTNGE